MSTSKNRSKIFELISKAKSIEQLRLELSFIGMSLHDEDVITQISTLKASDRIAYRCLISNGKPVLLSNQGDELDDSAWKEFDAVYSAEFYDDYRIKEFPFEKCPNLKRVKRYAFKSTGLTSAVIPDSCTNIEAYAFVDCNSLKKVVIPSTVKKIDSYAFSYCPRLEELVLNEGLEEIGQDAFAQAFMLQGKTIWIPDSCKHIEMYAFAGIRNLHVSLPFNCHVYTDAFPADVRLFYRPDTFFY